MLLIVCAGRSSLLMLPLFAACAAPPASSRAHRRPAAPAHPHPCQPPPPPANRAHLCSSLASARVRPLQPEEPLAIQLSAVPLSDCHFERRCFCLRWAFRRDACRDATLIVQIASIWGLTPHPRIPTPRSMWMQPRTVKGAADALGTLLLS